MSTPLYQLVSERAPEGRLVVVRFRGVEAASRPFRFDVVARARGGDLANLPADLLGQRASFQWGGEAPRLHHGVITAIGVTSAAGAAPDELHVRVRVEPKLCLLRR